MEFLAAFLVFALAVAGMAVGVLLGGRRLQGSCGGVAADGSMLADCLCERKKKDLCASDEHNELVRVAQLGWPKRQSHSHGRSPAEAEDADRFEV